MEQELLVAVDVEKAPTIQYIDKASETIFHQREHALVGISPSNGYYKEENIYQTLKWVNTHFKDYTIFPGQRISYYTFLSCGYTEREAEKKTRSQDLGMFNRIVKVLNKLGRKDITILKETDYLSNEQYNLCYEKYVQFFRQDVDLQNNVYKIISNLTLSGRKVINKEIAAQYFLAELPLLLNTPDILGISSSCFIYHKIMDIAELIYSQKNLQAPNQGFMAVEFA